MKKLWVKARYRAIMINLARQTKRTYIISLNLKKYKEKHNEILCGN